LGFGGGMKRIADYWQILIALALATATALAFRVLFHDSSEESIQAQYVQGALASCRFVGDLFMRALKMINGSG